MIPFFGGYIIMDSEPAEFKTVKIELNDGIARLILDQPPLNVLNIEMMREINSALDIILKTETVNVVIISAEGKAFSAGVDVAEHTEDKVQEMVAVFHQIFENLYNLAPPVVAVVDGAALGGGCELASFCDIVIASERSKFGQPEIQVGVFPPIAAIMFPRMMYLKKAFELILTGDIISATEAQKIGLVNQVFPVENFNEDSENYIAKVANNSAVVNRITKRAFYKVVDKDYDKAIKKIEKIYLDELMKTEDANEGLKAFLEKRKPVWKNK
jgi:cyclohexa-1,5-dienecarbonyl-CoA hydratase